MLLASCGRGRNWWLMTSCAASMVVTDVDCPCSTVDVPTRLWGGGKKAECKDPLPADGWQSESKSETTPL
jgi:hypothetical protein